MADWRTDDRELLARILMAEAGNQGPIGMTAVGNVIMNRANTTGYGDGIRGVIMRPGQFSPMNSVTGYAGGEQGQNIDSLRPDETHYMVADTLLSGNAGDLTGGATHFFNPDISNPSWAEGKDFSRIGDHVFGSADAGRGGTQATTTTQGASPMMIEEQPPQGLLGSFGIQKMEEGAAGETGQRFYERDTFKDTAAALAQGFAAMGSRPGLQKMTANIANQRSEAKARNKTVEYLRANGRGDLADMIEQGMISGKDAAGVMLAKPTDDGTAAMQNYAEYQRILASDGQEAAQEFLAMSRSGTTINTGDVGDGNYIYGSDAGLPPGYRLNKQTGEASVIPGGQAETAAAAAAEEAGSAGTMLAETAIDQIALIDSIIKDKALPSITGIVQGRLPPMSQAGEDLNVKVAQLQGKVFLEAFQSLKGAGAITEREGIAAAEAGARLRRTQSGTAYIAALNELKKYLDRGRRRALAGVTAADGDSYSGGVIGGVTVGAPIE
tara:strand:- start:17 stop:1504 length:1488 start_codon:yes stop_codon:yes gene_type:complete